MQFLPEDYSVPSTSDFMKFQTGENTFRVMSQAVTGWEYWDTDNKPVRLKEKPSITPSNIKKDKDGNDTSIKHFWSFVVWNYNDKAIQSLEITQKTLMDGIKALVDNKQWGNPIKYDLTVNKSGEGLKTAYSVMPNPHSELSPEIIAEFEAKAIDLQKIFETK